jgi:hypothetical protein
MNHVTTLPVTPAAVLNNGVAGPEIQLPKLYEAARQAIEACANLDECKEWADKSAALRAYAVMRDDVALTSYAQRIHLRSVRQIGVLLKQIEPQQGGDRGNAATGGRPPIAETRTQAAEDAGLSEHQRKTALRVANVPEPQFTRQAESASTPTVTLLAEQGTLKRTVVRDPAAFISQPAFGKSQHRPLATFAEFCESIDPVSLASMVKAEDCEAVRQLVTIAEQWLMRFVDNLPADQ